MKSRFKSYIKTLGYILYTLISFPNIVSFMGLHLCASIVLRTMGDTKKKMVLSLMNLICVKTNRVGFPGGAAVGSLPAGAGDTGSSPGLGGSHMPRSNWAREPQLLSLRVWNLCSTTREAATVREARAPR